jgi:hypothetical protein
MDHSASSASIANKSCMHISLMACVFEPPAPVPYVLLPERAEDIPLGIQPFASATTHHNSG